MATGHRHKKGGKQKAMHNIAHADEVRKAYTHAEARAQSQWHQKWGWTIAYSRYFADIPDIAMKKIWEENKHGPDAEKVGRFLRERKASIRHELSDQKRAMNPNLRPTAEYAGKSTVPRTSNAMYGWTPSKKCYALNDAYGRDVRPIGDINKRLGWPKGVAM